MELSQLRGNISMIRFMYPKGPYSPSLDERTIFFAVANGLDDIRYFVSSLRNNYIAVVKDHAHKSS